MIVFGTTVAWSIYTTGTKARQLLAKEKREQERADGKTVEPTETTQLEPNEDKQEYFVEFDRDAFYSDSANNKE